MALTYNHVLDHLRRILHLGQAGFPPHLRPMEIANIAGRELCNAHQWAWLSNVTGTLDIAAGAEYVDLPANLKQLHGITLTDTVVGYARPSTPVEIMQLRENTVGTTAWNYLYWAVTPTHDGGEHRWQLQLWPAHSAERPQAITLLYTANWTEITSDEQTLTLPTYLEAIYIDMLEAIALGWDEENAALRTERVHAVLASPSMVHAKQVDGMATPFLGAAQNGAAFGSRGVIPWQHGYAYGGSTGNL